MSTSSVALLLYLFTRASTMSAVFSGMAVALGIAFVASMIFYGIWFLATSDDPELTRAWHDDKRAKFYHAVTRTILPCWILFGTLHILTPNQKDMMLIVGGAVGYHGVTAIVSDDRIQETGGKIFDLMNVWLDEQIDTRRTTESTETTNQGETP